MARSVPYIRTVSDQTSWQQDQALNATIYILREIGPTGYLLKEEGESKKFKVLIGDPHSCTCPAFRKERDVVCKHICWVLLKKFKVPRENPVTWQRGLVEREINELLRGLMTRQAARRPPSTAGAPGALSEKSQGRPQLEQREISEEDVCPICQDELLARHEPVTYCKFGCGNSVHIKCMKVWAEHQKSTGDPVIKCPMCRQDFGPYENLRQEFHNSSTRTTRAERLNQHLGTSCHKCHISPIQGKCYKCGTCAEMYLCQTCFNTDHHRHHSFLFRQKPSQRWRDVRERGSGSALPQAVVHNLMNRDISDQDYDLLLQLDSQAQPVQADIPEEFIKSLPCEKIRSPTCRLLEPGQQCRVCLRAYEFGQFVRRLPCNHRFHADCIDAYLMHQRPSCPLDGQIVWSPGMQQRRQRRAGGGAAARPEGHDQSGVTAGELILEIPGIGLAHRTSSGSRPGSGSTVLRAVDERGTVHTMSSQLTMTGSAITPARPDWLTINNRGDVAPPVANQFRPSAPAVTNQHRLPPTGRPSLASRIQATPPMRNGGSAELLVGRRASEPVALEQRSERSRPAHRLVSVRTRSRERTPPPARHAPVQTPPSSRNPDPLTQEFVNLYLGQYPATRAALLREVVGKPRPLRTKPRPHSDGNTERGRGLDISLTGHQVQ